MSDDDRDALVEAILETCTQAQAELWARMRAIWAKMSEQNSCDQIQGARP